MTVVAVYHIKGGVGKTSASVNLAYNGAQAGNNTLLWDLDPQGSATWYYRIKPKIRGGLKPVVQGSEKLLKSIKGTDFRNLDMLPADFSLRNLDLALMEAKSSRKRLRAALKPLIQEYDLIFLDCPPNVTLLTENILRAADIILCPIIPTTLSHRTLVQLKDFMESEGCNAQLWPFFSMVERRKSMHKELMNSLPELCGPFLETAIPYLSDVERMGIHREPVAVTNPRSNAAHAFASLYTELAGLGKPDA